MTDRLSLLKYNDGSSPGWLGTFGGDLTGDRESSPQYAPGGFFASFFDGLPKQHWSSCEEEASDGPNLGYEPRLFFLGSCLGPAPL